MLHGYQFKHKSSLRSLQTLYKQLLRRQRSENENFLLKGFFFLFFITVDFLTE